MVARVRVLVALATLLLASTAHADVVDEAIAASEALHAGDPVEAATCLFARAIEHTDTGDTTLLVTRPKVRKDHVIQRRGKVALSWAGLLPTGATWRLCGRIEDGRLLPAPRPTAAGAHRVDPLRVPRRADRASVDIDGTDAAPLWGSTAAAWGLLIEAEWQNGEPVPLPWLVLLSRAWRRGLGLVPDPGEAAFSDLYATAPTPLATRDFDSLAWGRCEQMDEPPGAPHVVRVRIAVDRDGAVHAGQLDDNHVPQGVLDGFVEALQVRGSGGWEGVLGLIWGEEHVQSSVDGITTVTDCYPTLRLQPLW